LYFYLSPCRDFKNYYLYYLSNKYKGYFALPSYSRIIQLWPRLILPLVIILQLLKGIALAYILLILPNYLYAIENVPVAIGFLRELLR
jgi:hypothetical protein